MKRNGREIYIKRMHIRTELFLFVVLMVIDCYLLVAVQLEYGLYQKAI